MFKIRHRHSAALYACSRIALAKFILNSKTTKVLYSVTMVKRGVLERSCAILPKLYEKHEQSNSIEENNLRVQIDGRIFSTLLKYLKLS